MRPRPLSPVPALPLRRLDGPPRLAEAALRLAQWCGRCLDRRRQRQALGELDDRLLRDIGVSRAEADREARKRPWD